MSQLVPTHWRRSFDEFFEDMSNMFGSLLPQHRNDNADLGFWFPSFKNGSLPKIDLRENEDEVIVRAEIPGLEKDDFQVEVTDDRLTILGDKKMDRKEKKREYYYRECSYGSFSRTISLPCEVKADKAKAKYRKGILEIKLPKVEESKRKQIKVNVA